MKDSLHICWGVPSKDLVKENDSILYLSQDFSNLPSDIKCKQIFNGIKESIKVRNEVVSIYLEMIADIGLVKKNGRTFRDALKLDAKSASIWWYHMCSCKDNTNDNVFEDLIVVCTIKMVVQRFDGVNLVIHSISKRLQMVLSSKWPNAKFVDSQPENPLYLRALTGIASRLNYILPTVKKIILTRRCKKSGNNSFDVAFFGFWDWSVKLNSNGELQDNYFKKVPNILRGKGINSLCWLVWLDPHAEPGSENRQIKKSISHSCTRKEIYFLQSYLSLFDLFREIFRISPIFVYLSFKKKIRLALNKNEFDFYPLFRKELLYRFLDDSIINFRLVELATSRACSFIQPKVTMSFLETYAFSRACYSGVDSADEKIINIAVQHAARNEESVFFRLHPEKEYLVGVDGHSIPKADYVFTMGRFGYELVKQSGYNDEHNILTGSPRFDYVTRSNKVRNKSKENFCIVYAASGVIDIEIPAFMMVVRAVKQMMGVKLILREHFFWKISNNTKVRDAIEDIEVSTYSLGEDLERADLILYTTTTLADEAIMRMVPVWQIISMKSNFSSLKNIQEVKKIYSESQLIRELSLRIKEGNLEEISNSLLDSLERDCFYKCDGLASERVANQVQLLIKSTELS